MYCPWCGGLLADSEGDGSLECKTSGMSLSKKLESRLRDVFEFPFRDSEKHHLDKSGGWFCAGCGVRLVPAEDGTFRCPRCNRTMGEFVFELVEVHPHI